MDPITHTIIAVGLLAAAYFTGRYLEKQKAIEYTLGYLIHYGACTEDDIRRANERFEEERNGE